MPLLHIVARSIGEAVKEAYLDSSRSAANGWSQDIVAEMPSRTVPFPSTSVSALESHDTSTPSAAELAPPRVNVGLTAPAEETTSTEDGAARGPTSDSLSLLEPAESPFFSLPPTLVLPTRVEPLASSPPDPQRCVGLSSWPRQSTTPPLTLSAALKRVCEPRKKGTATHDCKCFSLLQPSSVSDWSATVYRCRTPMRRRLSSSQKGGFTFSVRSARPTNRWLDRIPLPPSSSASTTSSGSAKTFQSATSTTCQDWGQFDVIEAVRCVVVLPWDRAGVLTSAR